MRIIIAVVFAQKPERGAKGLALPSKSPQTPSLSPEETLATGRDSRKSPIFERVYTEV